MRHILLAAALLSTVLMLLPAPMTAAELPFPPRLSPPAQVTQVVGLTEVSFRFGRPRVNDRKVWGELVPYGEIWRTGADNATVVELSTEVEVEGKKLAAGRYALMTVPASDGGWTLVFNGQPDQWGAFSYAAEHDVLRVPVKARKVPSHQEAFQIEIAEIADSSMDVVLSWDQLEVPFTVQVPEITHEALLARAEEVMASQPHGFVLWEWVGVLQQQGVQDDRVVAWAEQLTEAVPNFFTLSLRAQVLAAHEQAPKAIEIGRQALEVGRKNLGTNQFLTEQVLDDFSDTIEGWQQAD